MTRTRPFTMNLISFICIIIGVSLNACAQLLLKAGVNAVGHFDFTPANIVPVGLKIATQLPIIGGLSCYVLSVVVWIVGLSRVDVSIAYPMLSLGYVVNAFAAWYLFGEVLSMQRLIGIGIILVGVVVLARG
ncbi:4-amino-4-deoxy-L-arabinose transferase [Caballeronia sp. LZ032]|nr:EamA family transporter [Caballeronia sp. LZ032]MDR5877915.1 4-amino-4-deoxy-L-arabinose transferase [Caballeronia sp. LZ032]